MRSAKSMRCWHLRGSASAFQPRPACPEILDEKQHSLRIKGVRNPVIAFEEPSYVANDGDFDKARLSFITGPNSGGKTALCKTDSAVPGAGPNGELRAGRRGRHVAG